MPVRQRAADRGAARGRGLLAALLREAESARVASGLGHAAIARAVGVSRSTIARTLQGRWTDVGVIALARLLAVLGLELAVRAYPGGAPTRDASHLGLIDRFRKELGPGCASRAEVPVIEVPTPGNVDLRAWDLAVDGPGWSLRVDAETRLGDVQAVQRRVTLKQRDSRIDVVILLVSDTRNDRAAVRLAGAALRAQFPFPARRALRRLRAGQSPGGNTLILL